VTAEHKHPNYMAIFYALIVLTVVEIGIAYLPHWLPSVQNIRAISIVLLIAFALVKALLVAMYFMHLRFERRTFVVIVSAPVVLAVVLILSLLPDVGQLGAP
jgi:cytochrome c oxidase subunit 4